MTKRPFLKTLALAALLAAAGTASAQTTPIKFQLDWRFEGPAALFLTP
ncbi:MAG: ABC transporter substrate-binding protein, partial [Ramlibacter sp.]